MKILISMLIVCFFTSVMTAEEKKGGDKISELWQEMLAEKKNYGKMKKAGSSKEELKLQETLINELYKSVVALKKDKYGDVKKDKKADGPIADAWQKVITAKKEYGAMEKGGASEEELAGKKAAIEELYKRVVVMKKAKYNK